jgi:hypothetical protein
MGTENKARRTFRVVQGNYAEPVIEPIYLVTDSRIVYVY